MAAKPRHVDGKLDRPYGCTACHGKLTGTTGVVRLNGNPEAAPGYDATSVDVNGNTDRSQVGVGAHIKHVNSASMTMMSAKSCAVCHVVPVSDSDEAHVDGGATEMQWTGLASAGGVTAKYTAPNCTNYCHSTGDPLGVTTAVTTQLGWTTVGALNCASCHLYGTIATNAHGKHATKYLCSDCHHDTTQAASSIYLAGGTHVNGANDVVFDGASAFVGGGGYTSPTCSNIYCHSQGTVRSAPYTSGPSVPWTGSTSCMSCHGGPLGQTPMIGSAGNGTPRHLNHVNVVSQIGGAASTNFECGTCHASTVDTGTDAPVTGSAAHVDRIASVTFDSFYAGTFTAGAPGSGTCASNYCHSSGQAAAVIQYRTVTWDGPALDCAGATARRPRPARRTTRRWARQAAPTRTAT